MEPKTNSTVQRQHEQQYIKKHVLKPTIKFSNDNIGTMTLCTSRSEQLFKERKKEIKHLNLLTFKIYRCEEKNCPEIRNCLFFHSEQDRRRSPIKFRYVSDMCQNMSTSGTCPTGEACKYAHNHFEALYHHSKYKKRFCNSYPYNLQECKYQLVCSYAHSEEEISITLLHNMVYDVDFYLYHYKTQFCPFGFVNHNRSLCVYAHNWQDLRRNPLECQIQPVQCQLWKQTNFLVHYSEGCPNGSKCQYCHGWKEQEFHVFNYKTMPCEDKRCKKDLACPSYHAESEKR